MKMLLFLVIPALIYAEGLKSLLDYATINNNIVASKILTQESNLKTVESSKSAYYPTIDAGGSYQNLNARIRNTPGDIYSGYATVGVDLYDGGRRKNTIKKNIALLKSSKYDTKSYKKSLQLSITQDFYTAKSLEASLRALGEKQIQLKAELERIKKFYEVGSATKDDIDKLQAAYSNNVYQIDATKFQILSLKKSLSVEIGKKITTLDDSTIKIPKDLQKDLSDDIKALKASASSLTYTANTINSAYLPQISLKDTYNLYSYGRTDTMHPSGLDNQNKLMLTFNIKLFDHDALRKQKESILIQKRALGREIKQLEQIQDINVELALSKINTTKAQIVSAKISLESANSAYETIAKKYDVGVVDNVTYLDALSVKTSAKAQYARALNDLQVAYASYYFYTNKNIQEYVK